MFVFTELYPSLFSCFTESVTKLHMLHILHACSGIDFQIVTGSLGLQLGLINSLIFCMLFDRAATRETFLKEAITFWPTIFLHL